MTLEQSKDGIVEWEIAVYFQKKYTVFTNDVTIMTAVLSLCTTVQFA